MSLFERIQKRILVEQVIPDPWETKDEKDKKNKNKNQDKDIRNRVRQQRTTQDRVERDAYNPTSDSFGPPTGDKFKEQIPQAEIVRRRKKQFDSSFGTPTGADPKTGKPTYRRLQVDTELPKGRGGGVPTGADYERVTKPTTKGGGENPNYLGAKAEKTKIYTEPKKVTVTREVDGKKVKVIRKKLVPSEKGIIAYARRALEKRRQAGGEGTKQAAADVETILKDPKTKADYAKKIRQKYGGIIAPEASAKELKQIEKDLRTSKTIKAKPLPKVYDPKASKELGTDQFKPVTRKLKGPESKLIDTKKRRLRIYKKPVINYIKDKEKKLDDVLKDTKKQSQRLRTIGTTTGGKNITFSPGGTKYTKKASDILRNLKKIKTKDLQKLKSRKTNFGRIMSKVGRRSNNKFVKLGAAIGVPILGALGLDQINKTMTKTKTKNTKPVVPPINPLKGKFKPVDLNINLGTGNKPGITNTK